MNKSRIALALVAFALAGCNEEKRNGQLTLAGSTPLKIQDQSGKTVEFVSGPLKVVFDPEGSTKVAIKLEQDGRTAKFTGQVPRGADWNFSIRGQDIGQNVDLDSSRKIELYGPITRTWGTGGHCGFNGRWETEDEWRKGNEDWDVAFADSASGKPAARFKSRREGQDYLISSRNTWCRERPEHDRGRWDRVSEKLSNLKENGVKFD